MQSHNKPGQCLSPQLKAIIEPIFRRDPVRYAVLIRFVWFQQKRGFSDEAIGKCVLMADGKHGNLDYVSNLYAYLMKLIPKASARAHEAENEGFKKDDFSSVKAILREIVK